MGKDKNINRYKLVQETVERAKKMEQEDRLRLVDKKESYIKTINEVEPKRNYVVEALTEIEKELKEEKDVD